VQLTLWLFGAEVFSVRIGPPPDEAEEPERAHLLESYPISHLPDREIGTGEEDT
jgi:hypothetical protein